MKETLRDKLIPIRDFILARGKLVFPILLIAAVAVTVSIALRARYNKDIAESSVDNTQAVSAGDIGEIEVPDVPLEVNAYPEINSLLATYFEAKKNGDADTIVSIKSSVEDMERIKIQELGKYIENYSIVDIYTKPGPEENSFIVIVYTKLVMSYYPDDYLPGYETYYVCTKEDGSLYIYDEIVSDEVFEYIRKIMMQDDVVELLNKITVEYKEICIEKPELLRYIAEVEQEIKAAVGVILAQQIADVSGGDGSTSDGDIQAMDTEISSQPEDLGPLYATATDTVNVRNSDSVEADKLGRLLQGTRVEILEQKANGWSKIVFEGKDGFVKSEFLSIAESAEGVETIGTVTAIDNVNVRASANQSAEKLGVVTNGETLELIANEGEWCKVKYNGQIGYVKAEFVQ